MLKIINLRTGYETVGCGHSVLCLGSFDGVHKGHAELIRKTIEKRTELSGDIPGILGGAWCFLQPPADFLSKNPPAHLTTIDEKLEIFAALGLDIAVLGDFPQLRRLSPGEFVGEILKTGCGCEYAVCGFNFRFGDNGVGNPETLSELFKGKTIVVPPVTIDNKTVSSSTIRTYILNGLVDTAEALMGRAYSLTSEVVHGKSLGGKLGLPTVNQYFPAGKLIPAFGVYASKTIINGQEYYSVSNVGKNPTLGVDNIRCETHIFGFSGDLYGNNVRVLFKKHLRSEVRFPNTDMLVAAIRNDISDAKEYFGINS